MREDHESSKNKYNYNQVSSQVSGPMPSYDYQKQAGCQTGADVKTPGRLKCVALELETIREETENLCHAYESSLNDMFGPFPCDPEKGDEIAGIKDPLVSGMLRSTNYIRKNIRKMETLLRNMNTEIE